jgi:hypothetical protein
MGLRDAIVRNYSTLALVVAGTSFGYGLVYAVSYNSSPLADAKQSLGAQEIATLAPFGVPYDFRQTALAHGCFASHAIFALLWLPPASGPPALVGSVMEPAFPCGKRILMDCRSQAMVAGSTAVRATACAWVDSERSVECYRYRVGHGEDGNESSQCTSPPSQTSHVVRRQHSTASARERQLSALSESEPRKISI